MNTKIIILFFSLITVFSRLSTAAEKPQQKEKNKEKSKEKTAAVTEDAKDKTKTVAATKPDTLKTKEVKAALPGDSLQIDPNAKFKFYKKNAHASYYHNKFNGRRTASGKRFDNTKYTAAHKKLPFGTIVKVTNEANGKSVIVEITDRGPFSKVREIDLTRKAFMEIASNKNSGSVIVKLEIIEKPATNP
ncbi:septal ring lytic transglycosylase RlpA family protein [Flavobacterium sedimenticola]|uniref:septal ring lytic transglycosylase RlpA family protein n=1 Tax=Flavobacterium sedimenticola TaxID=3043286 RepID=UPI002AA2AE3D|nr:septal ring lytic transglycosylase RlpA family protein [Flavobacterium sedimenticola]